MKNPRLIDLSGQTFGLWSVISQAGNTPRGAALWLARCQCGVEKAVLGSDLRRGTSLSCGCAGSRSTLGARAHQHGGTGTRLYTTWKNMRARCADATNANYGGRGISVCPEWDDFATFERWAIDAGYADTMTIERRDVNGGYSAANCEWIAPPHQAKNKTTSRKAPDGRLWVHIAVERGITASAFRCRVSAGGWTPEEAASVPLGARRAARSKDGAGRFATVETKAWRR